MYVLGCSYHYYYFFGSFSTVDRAMNFSFLLFPWKSFQYPNIYRCHKLWGSTLNENACRMKVIHVCKMFLYGTIKLIVHHVTHSAFPADLYMWIDEYRLNFCCNWHIEYVITLSYHGSRNYQTCLALVCTKRSRLQLKCDGTRWRTGGEVKGKLANAVVSQYSSHYLGTWCIQHYP